MTTKWQLRRAWKIAIVVVALVFVGFGSAYYHWCWRSETGGHALQNAEQTGLVALVIPDVPDLPHTERIRAVFPGSNSYLLHSPGLSINGRETNSYSHVDTASNTIRSASRSEWEAATGEIIDTLHDRHIRPKLAANPKTAGHHLRWREIAPRSNNVAVFSADGRLHPPVQRFFIGGRNEFADGQRYVEVQSVDGQAVITPAVLIPSPCTDEPKIWWTADERFVVCRYTCNSNPRTPDSIVLVATGLETLPILKSGVEAKSAGFAVFQTDLWWEEWRGAIEFEIRNESSESPILLFNMPVRRLNTQDGFLVYRYDPEERTLSPVQDDAWLSATSSVFNERDLLPKDEGDPQAKRIRENLGNETPKEDLAYLIKDGERKNASKERRGALLKRSPPRGGIVLGPFYSPDGILYATHSYDKEATTFYHEIFNTVTGQPIVDLLELPKTLGEGPLWTPDGRYILYCNQESRLLTIIHTDRALP